MSLNRTLKATELGAAPKDLEGIPPLRFKAIGEPLVDWSINGASGGVGEKTENLCGLYKTGYYVNGSGVEVALEGFNIYSAAVDSSTTYTFSLTYTSGGETTVRCCEYDENGDFISKIFEKSLAKMPVTFNTSNSTKSIKVSITQYAENIMLNEGSTANPYEPYGYKIPITCGGETNTIYLDAPLGTTDSISMADTGISIPTVNGLNILSVGTIVQPSSVHIKYKRGGDEMVTLVKIGGRYNVPILEIRGLSTDTKPTTKIEGMNISNGSTYVEIDTGDTYMFDAENRIWYDVTT